MTNSPLVLVVDDEQYIRNALQRILRSAGYQARTAPDGETALLSVGEEEPDVILLDLLMPGMDGREVCRRVRQLSTTCRIIYFSAKMVLVNSLELKMLSREADAFLAKPATSKQILSRVSGVLGNDP